MIDAVVPVARIHMVFRHLGALNWTVKYTDEKEVNVCFYFDNCDELNKTARRLRTLERFGIRWREK